MDKQTIHFTKQLLFLSSFPDFKNKASYEIVGGQPEKSTLNLRSSFFPITAEIHLGDSRYSLKPSTTFLSPSEIDIFSELDKIGELTYHRWFNRPPRLTLYKDGSHEVWLFKGQRFKRGAKPYRTTLECQESKIEYEIQPGDFFHPYTTCENLRKLNGTMHLGTAVLLTGVLGIYLNELLIFDKMMD